MGQADRRRFLIASAALLTSTITFGQPKVRVIGWLVRDKPGNTLDLQQENEFKAGMRDFGYVEGRDYRLEPRFGSGDLRRLEALAGELVTAGVDVIVVFTTDATTAARKATQKVPIIAVIGDPVAAGFAASLSASGGNVTGIATLSTGELAVKRLDLLRQVRPGVQRVGYMYNPDYAADHVSLAQFEKACSDLHLTAIRAPVRTEAEIAARFKELMAKKVQGLLTTSTSVYYWRRTIIEQATKDRLPVVYARSAFVDSGGLMAYSADYRDVYRRVAGYADKIFKGANVAQLPIEQPTKFELLINLRTAKRTGIKIPQSLLQRADKVVE